MLDRPNSRKRYGSILFFAAVNVIALQSVAQPPQTRTALPLDATAVVGEPFGVFAIEVPYSTALDPETSHVRIADDQDRILYPSIKVKFAEAPEPAAEQSGVGRGRLLNRLRTVIRGDRSKRQIPVGLSIRGLFKGDAPLAIEVRGDLEKKLTVKPVSDVGSHRRLLETWWSDYSDNALQMAASGDHPSLVERYLTTMLARRLALPEAKWDTSERNAKRDGELQQPLDTLSLLAGIEPLRDQVLQRVLSEQAETSSASVPIPSAPRFRTTELPLPEGNVSIEPIAKRVPPDCFYLRFGTFSNYVWFQETSQRFGGDIAQAILIRGFNYETNARIERMLGAKLSTIAKLFGDQVIDDMALVGYDLYIKEGASLGVIFSAKNAALLMSTMSSERKALADRTDGASLQEVTIADRKVSLLSTPDNRLRSFLLRDGDYVLVTTSRALVERFIEVGSTGRSLAELPSFQWARQWMPESNGYSVFAFMSPDFFHNLVGPHYQIELRRRLEAIAHLEIAEVAGHAARAEGNTIESIDAYRALGLVPEWFDRRADGSQTLRIGDQWIDSLRGARGAFLPIADVELRSVDEHELKEYQKVSQYYQDRWQEMDPLLFGLRRFQLEGHPEIERIAIEAYVAPFKREKYGLLADQLGPPSPIEIALPTDDIAAVQLHMGGEDMLGRPRQDYHLIAGVKDLIPPSKEETKGLIKTLLALKALPAYMGAWPIPSILDKLPLGLANNPPDINGFSRMIGGVWRWQNAEFSLISCDRAILESAIPQLAVLRSEDLAQVRLRVSNLKGTKLAGWVNHQWYQRGWQGSHGNARFIDTIQQQLKVPAEESQKVAEQILDVRLQCPLGGQYELKSYGKSNDKRWVSTAWENAIQGGEQLLPADGYVAPWIKWFRGGKFHLTQLPNHLAVVGTVDLELGPMPKEAGGIESGLPKMDFNLFQLPMKIFGIESKP